ncbi:Stk1 family PASTA domain-containing Ser/Thr kinase [Nakamurella multipartita]|uniref:non-specific serine/threonine protein kinase n=1 Tax=Nakamurella multipartita (strain ATCC 700099 / DSM 44233 / CIP 104796 / JCM 9543 / NBRC 105858 / Y-104) TaxID=479431 RepID=C8XCV0_NAKMY|nr:Stk1 family PASTA domain-containing Ser/Thr kinase [Nakamurella multipartita]ACV79553.1 serine/threonine protein kinase with PASTA sensor(s) [Nakamurella multipartita DSM 44233]
MDVVTGPASGTVLDGRYRLGAMIARGGMSTVYRGLDTRLDRPVAVKVMSPQYVADPTFLSRFEREARLAASLGHPGVVAMYDQGQDGDLVFLVMELVDGGTLRDLIRERGPLPVPVVLAVLDPLLDALAAAHAAGLVHRDVKPENVLISARGSVKIADFGLVRAVGSQTVATGDVILGTVAYLSPEQVATGVSDARTDVYAAGIVAFEMLTGRPPFEGDNPMSVAYQHVHSDVPAPSTRVDDVPAQLDELIVAATARNPDDRPRDASAFLAELRDVRTALHLPIVPVPIPVRPRPSPTPPVPVPIDHPAGQTGTRMLPADAASTAYTADTAKTAEGAATTPPTRVQKRPPPVARTRTAAARRRRRWLIALLVVLLLGLISAAGGWWLGGRWAATPAAAGLTQSQAEAAVREAGLVPRVTTGHSDTVPDGVVIGTDPDSGVEQLRGSEVSVLVSAGRPRVPDIKAGTDTATATAALTAADLTVVTGTGQEFDDAVPVGAVLRTDPVGGTELSVDAPVTLILSAGPRPIVVPQVVGQSQADATKSLTDAGFTIGTVTKTFDARVEPGRVLRTDPTVGSTAARGSAVALTVADSITVPDVRGRSTKDAIAAMRDAGFSVTVGDPAFDAGVDAGDILRSDPGPGTRVDRTGASVFLVPSNAVTVPDLTDQKVKDAERTLADLGLKIDVTSFFGGDNGTVWNQSPAAGGRVRPGDTVSVYVLR